MLCSIYNLAKLYRNSRLNSKNETNYHLKNIDVVSILVSAYQFRSSNEWSHIANMILDNIILLLIKITLTTSKVKIKLISINRFINFSSYEIFKKSHVLKIEKSFYLMNILYFLMNLPAKARLTRVDFLLVHFFNLFSTSSSIFHMKCFKNRTLGRKWFNYIDEKREDDHVLITWSNQNFASNPIYKFEMSRQEGEKNKKEVYLILEISSRSSVKKKHFSNFKEIKVH